MQIDTSDVRKGLKVIELGEPHIVTDFDFVKPGKGNAFTRTRLKSMVTGKVIDRTYKTGEKLTAAKLEERDCQYLYDEGDFRVFMDTGNYEQYRISAEVLGEHANYLYEGLVCQVWLWEGRPLSTEMPNFVVLEVMSTGAGNKTDRATGATKEAVLSTGYTIQVPLFINEGDAIRIDTRTGDYVERAKK